jgi:hypothetical protein
MFVIGVAGQAQHGKDTLSDRLCEILNEKKIKFDDPNWPKHGSRLWVRAAFAVNVKKVYEETFGVDRDFIEEWKVKPEIPEGFDMSVRQGLQFIGDGFRKIRSTIWVDLCFRDQMPKIISDVRYINEFERVHQEGGLNVLVGRSDKLNDDPNGSEAIIRPFCEYALKNLEDGPLSHLSEGAPPKMNLFDYFVRNDGTKEEFYEKIEKGLVPFISDFSFKHKEQS